MSLPSEHADLLNDLSVMQGALPYALRRDVIRKAELLIAEQERELQILRERFSQLEKIFDEWMPELPNALAMQLNNIAEIGAKP